MKKTLLAFVLAVLPSLLFAADQKFAFALPDLEGRISLGVFNVRGKLVRTLYVGATTADFTIGLNGLIATWDGKSENGTVMPAGKYFVKGFVVGDAVKAEGEAYHFNDWIEDEKSPRIVKVEDFQQLERGFVLLVQVPKASGLFVIRYDLEKGFLWATPLELDLRGTASLDSFRGVVVSDGMVATRTPARFQTFDLAGGQSLKWLDYQFPANGMAAWNKTLYVGSLSKIQKFSLPDLSPLGEEVRPDRSAVFAVASDRKIASGVSAVYLSLNDLAWTSIPTGVNARSLSFGLKDTFWVAGTEAENGAALVGQYNFKGELLRAYRGDFTPEQVCVSTSSEEISVLEKKDATQRLRQMDLVDRPGGGTEWEISFEKSITPCAKFGIVGGELVADAGETPQQGTMEFPLATGGLTAEAPKLTVQLASDAAGLWLETASKLKLVRLADQTGANRYVLAPGENKASMTAYAGDGVVVAEYLITGLDAIAEIDAGEIEIP